MNADTIISIVAAAISLISCGIACYFSSKAARHADESNRTSRSSLERNLRAAIVQAEHFMIELGFKVNQEKRDGGRASGYSSVAVDAAMERYLNAHESAAKYWLDKEIDQDRYLAEHRKEINNICKADSPFSRLMYPEEQSDYTSIWKVHRILNRD
ncbi:MAG: hypothetical protein LAT64_10120 [Phycisphaerales bacterium]|nr:hypothetical protein [Planctomycetota bacterium]MCH8509106.1 hypothetical protein [Phycisphaerales bacterium]